MAWLTDRRKALSARRYLESLAVWEDAHGSVRDDYTAPQWIRHGIYIKAIGAGLDVRRLAFWRWCAETGRLNDGE